ncbi:hypothetical protein [Flammeovirga sp. EKP202]|uniref:hypothetical protein n=1 Tax=Flammeovirga sp. EKP202 TaxID=2770592 RepID=UPI00165FC891|nr:hypothetical protein [Flammeovirga sp. EKP202]MBD0403199.1 hypothetical protein [Flammeovirga sp. EKP202]
MKKIKFTNLTITYENSIAQVNGEIERTETTFDENKIKEIGAAILQHLTSKGDINGNPITSNISIRGDEILGRQS